MSQVTGREDMRNSRPRQGRNAPALRQMSLDERAMPSPKFAKWMQSLHHSCALSPAAAGARREGSHADLAAAQRAEARLAQLFQRSRRCVRPVPALAAIRLSCFRGSEANRLARQPRRRLHYIFRGHIFDHGAGRQSVLREANAAAFQVRANLIVLRAIEPVLIEQGGEALVVGGLGLAARQEGVEEGLDHPA